MKDFTLIDLYSQREAVESYTAGWSADQLVNWLRQEGTLFEPEKETYHYLFLSRVGLHCIFKLSADRRIEVVAREIPYP